MRKDTRTADYTPIVKLGMDLSVAILKAKGCKKAASALEREVQSYRYYSHLSVPHGFQRLHAGLSSKACQLLNSVTMPSATTWRKNDPVKSGLLLKQEAFNFLVLAIRKGFKSPFDMGTARTQLTREFQEWKKKHAA